MTTNPLCALKIMGVNNMSGPDTLREVEIPAFNLTFKKNGKIKNYKDSTAVLGNTLLSTPATVYEINNADTLAEFQKLQLAAEEFEAAARRYEAAKAAFKETAAGEWIEELLQPDRPVAETLEARLPPGALKELATRLSAASLDPYKEEMKLSLVRYSGYRRVTITVNFTMGILDTEFSNICNALHWTLVSCECVKMHVMSATIWYGDLYQPHRMADYLKMEAFEREKWDFEGHYNTMEGDILIPQVVFPGVTLEDHTRYMTEQIRVFQHK